MPERPLTDRIPYFLIPGGLHSSVQDKCIDLFLNDSAQSGFKRLPFSPMKIHVILTTFYLPQPPFFFRPFTTFHLPL